MNKLNKIIYIDGSKKTGDLVDVVKGGVDENGSNVVSEKVLNTPAGVFERIKEAMQRDELKHACWLAGLCDEEKAYYEELNIVDEFGRVV